MEEAVLHTDIPGLKLLRRGKVRDIYERDAEHLLIVATDRISAFDCVMREGIPGKGKILTRMSLFWFDFLKDTVSTHLVTADVEDMGEEARASAAVLEGRTMLVRKAEVFPVECVVRGYLAGSGWREYREGGTVCGVQIPPGLREAEKLPEPIFTPATKAASGHDENITFERMCDIIGKEDAVRIRDLAVEIYTRAAEYAASKGIIIADTKFEFGRVDGGIRLVDEVLTPDSSRFWPASEYRVGGSPPSYDKQFVRDYLDSLDWDKNPPPPPLPADVIEKTRDKYMEALTRLTT